VHSSLQKSRYLDRQGLRHRRWYCVPHKLELIVQRARELERIGKALNSGGFSNREPSLKIGMKEVLGISEACIHGKGQCIPSETTIFTIKSVPKIDAVADFPQVIFDE
jgi:hypothetical protein